MLQECIRHFVLMKCTERDAGNEMRKFDDRRNHRN